MIRRGSKLLSLLFAASVGVPAVAQPADQSHGQQIFISSAGPQTYDRQTQTVTFLDKARAIRGNVTVDADQLVGYLRKKPTPAPSSAHKKNNDGAMTGGATELYRIEAIGHVHIYTPTDQAWGDRAVYDIDLATLVMTGKHLKALSPQALMTARDTMEYHTREHMTVGRGDATVTTNDGKRIRADVLVALSKPDEGENAKPAASPAAAQSSGSNTQEKSSKLDRAYAWGHVLLRTPNETATGDRGVYVFDTQLARLVGHVKVTSGQNQNNGASAIVNVRTGVAIMNPAPGQRVQGLMTPNEASSSKPGEEKK